MSEDTNSSPTPQTTSPPPDVDGDGFEEPEPCDDNNVAINPVATDLVGHAIDQDCDGVDLLDEDGDGYDADFAGGTDCHDGDATIHPNATEVPYDGIDQDCDSQDFADVDGDGQLALGFGGLDCDGSTGAMVHNVVRFEWVAEGDVTRMALTHSAYPASAGPHLQFAKQTADTRN